MLDAANYAKAIRRTQEGARGGASFLHSMLFSREENGLKQFLERICKSSKITVMGLQGDMAPPLLGVALAHDFRFATETTTFVLSQPELGLPPSGALGFFLPRYVGQGRATELLLTKQKLTAQEALDLGLVNAVFPERTFEAQCLERIRALPQSAALLSRTKALLYDEREKALEKYLEHEYRIMEHAWADSSR